MIDAQTRRQEQEQEVDANYEAFNARLDDLFGERPGDFVLMKNRKAMGFFKTREDAFRWGWMLFTKGIFSVHKISSERESYLPQTWHAPLWYAPLRIVAEEGVEKTMAEMAVSREEILRLYFSKYALVDERLADKHRDADSEYYGRAIAGIYETDAEARRTGMDIIGEGLYSVYEVAQLPFNIDYERPSQKQKIAGWNGDHGQETCLPVGRLHCGSAKRWPESWR